MTLLQITDPSHDIRSGIAEKAGLLDPLNKIWFHKTAAAVIDADRCVRCGSCVAACPSQSISIATDGLPTLVRMCTGCSACWDYCPLAGMRPERLWELEADGSAAGELGVIRAAYTARALDPAPLAQDGGVVTALLESLLAGGEIDGVILTRARTALQGEAALLRSAEEVRAAAGSVYDQALPLALLNSPPPRPKMRLAFVGTPCQVTGLRTLQRYDWKYRETLAQAVTLTIGLFCSRSFDGLQLMRMLALRQVPLGDAARVAVSGGQLRVHNAGGEPIFSAPVREFAGAALRGCDECSDFSGHVADVAVGSVGSPEAWTSVLVRSEAGERAWAAAAAALESRGGCDLDTVAQHEGRDRRRAQRHMRREFDPEAPLWISYEEHLRTYTGTDREPVTPPGHRSHHYTVAC